MRRLVALCLLLAACTSRDPPTVQACRAQANDDPEVRRLVAASAGGGSFAREHQYELHDTRQQAVLRCLRARGLAAPGGVEAPRRNPSLFEGVF
jgi:hypothetical protein